MAHKKKLQVFVSSTYTDLHEERQAAVEAILMAGHIPAGMELFAAGDQSQMSVIKRWINESDVYLLILGGRYGSIEPESGKSYIHLEYEYAVAKDKPFFAVVIEEDHLEEKVKRVGSSVLEKENPQKLREFRTQVLSKIVRPWRDPRDIKLAIMETMSEFSRRDDLIGWIPGSEEVNTGAVAEEIARLGKENAELRFQVAAKSTDSTTYNGLTFEKMYKILTDEETNLSEYDAEVIETVNEVAQVFGDSKPGLLHLFWLLGFRFNQNRTYSISRGGPEYKTILALVDFGLVEGSELSGFHPTEAGRQLLLRLRLERETKKARQVVKRLPF
ncbi:MAG: hypothetical protein QOE77_1297 [Blastocatellia bacterium]|jgi:hypothetical protein|nr:hypothetical protein [Blastocatellia bacterium]